MARQIQIGPGSGSRLSVSGIPLADLRNVGAALLEVYPQGTAHLARYEQLVAIVRSALASPADVSFANEGGSDSYRFDTIEFAPDTWTRP